MEPTNTIKTNEVKKPLLVIKKGSLYKPNKPISPVVSLKRPFATAFAHSIPNAKKPCVIVPDSIQSVVYCTYIINQGKAKANPQNATEPTNTTYPTTFEKEKVEEIIVKESDQSNATPIQIDEIKTEIEDPIHETSTTSDITPQSDKNETQLSIRNNKESKKSKSSRCQSHEALPEHQGENLVRVGDTYNSLQEFEEYTNKHAQKWFFYYVRNDSRNLKTHSTYDSSLASYAHYFCRFHKSKYKSKSKGIRKQRSELSGIKCPAIVTLKCAVGKDVFTVLSVCHHHGHELSAELFNKTPHGHRLPKEIKDEIRDLALFNVDPALVLKYLDAKVPGLMQKKTLYNRFRKAKRKDSKKNMSPRRVEEILARIKYIKANFNTASRSSSKKPEKASKHQVKNVPQKAIEEVSSSNKAAIMPSSLEQTQSINTQVNTFEEPMKCDVVSENTNVVSEDINNCGDVTIQSEGTPKISNEATVFVGQPKPNNDTIQTIRKPKTTDYAIPKVQNFSVETRCQKRHVKFPEHRSVGLVRVGDTFSSMEEFARHAAAHALKWFFYYQVHDSRNVKTTDRYNSNRKTWYNLTCRFNKGWYKSTSTGARKIKRKTIKCPAMVSMMCNPGEDRFNVTYVCHHHSHELSHEIFSQEAHGHRLAPELKDEIRELAWFQLDRRLMRQYLQKKTGFDLKQTIKNVLGKMRQERKEIHVTPEKEKEILDKINDIKNTFTIPKRAPRRTRDQLANDEYDYDYEEGSESEDEGTGSRLERRLNNILYDEELIQSVKELQASTGCEIHIAPPCGEVNPANEEGIKHLQAGLEEEPHCNDLQHHDDDNNDSRIEIDQELYTMDENIHDFVPTDNNGAFDVDNIAPQFEDISSAEVEDNVCEEVCYAEDISPAEEIEVEDNALPTIHDDVQTEQNDYNMMYQYTNNGDPNVEIEYSEPTNYMNNEESYECRDVGVQADFELIELQKTCEYIQELEAEMLKEDVARSNISVSTRGRPKEVTEEGIINRYNVEFYMNVGGVIPCMEQLAAVMKLSVLDLLNKLYQSEAVFKMTAGRSGTYNRKTIHLVYVPLTIAFPYEKLKYINGLQEYKNICSKYSDVVVQLENTIESMSTDLKETKENLKNVESQKEEFLKVMKNYEVLVKDHAQNQLSLKKSQEVLEEKQNENKVLSKRNYDLSQQILKLQCRDLAEAHAQNQVLLEKIKDLESQLQEDKLQKQQEPILECQDSNISQNGDTNPCNKSKVLEEKSHIELTEKIKFLEQEVKESNANVKRYKNKVRDVEALYLTDSQSLLDKITSLEKELSMFRKEFYNINKSKTPSSTMLQFYEAENKKLHNEIKKLKEQRSPETETRKILKLEKIVTTLNKRLDVAKSKIKIGRN